MLNAWCILFLNKRAILDIDYFRFSYDNWLSHICLKFKHIQFKGLSRGFWASEELELTSTRCLCDLILRMRISQTLTKDLG